MKIVGILLIVLGVLALAYQGIRYTTREKLIDIGPLNVTTTEKKNIPLPPIVGGAAVVAGIALILVDRKKDFISAPPDSRRFAFSRFRCSIQGERPDSGWGD